MLDNSKYQNELQNLDKICIPVGYYSFPTPKLIHEYSSNILYTGTISATCGVDEIVELFSKIRDFLGIISISTPTTYTINTNPSHSKI